MYRINIRLSLLNFNSLNIIIFFLSRKNKANLRAGEQSQGKLNQFKQTLWVENPFRTNKWQRTHGEWTRYDKN